MSRIQLRGGTAAQWTAANPVLASREVGVETDTSRMKIGNGLDDWSARPYANDAEVAGIQAAIDAEAATRAAADAALTASLALKAPSTGIAQSAVTNLVSDLAGKQAFVETVNTVPTSGATQTLPDVTTATIHHVTLTANCTLTFPAAAAGKSFTLALVQDGTGSRLATWPAAVKWPSATAPTLSTGAGKVDYLSFACTDGTTWAGFLSGLDIR